MPNVAVVTQEAFISLGEAAVFVEPIEDVTLDVIGLSFVNDDGTRTIGIQLMNGDYAVIALGSL